MSYFHNSEWIRRRFSKSSCNFSTFLDCFLIFASSSSILSPCLSLCLYFSSERACSACIWRNFKNLLSKWCSSTLIDANWSAVKFVSWAILHNPWTFGSIKSLLFDPFETTLSKRSIFSLISRCFSRTWLAFEMYLSCLFRFCSWTISFDSSSEIAISLNSSSSSSLTASKNRKSYAMRVIRYKL